MKALPFEALDAAAWNALVEGSDDAWLMHRAEWVAIETRFFVARNCSFGLVEGERLVAVQPLYLSTGEQGTPHGERLLHCGVHRHAGLALAAGLGAAEAQAAQVAAMQRVEDFARGLGAERIQLGVHTLAPGNRGQVPFWVGRHGFQLGMGYGPNGVEPAPGFAVLAADQVVRLDRPEEALFAALDEACRRAVRKAEKAGLAFENGGTLERYWRLAQRSAERTGEALPARDYYAALFAGFAESGRLRCCFAREGERDVAALLLLDDKGAVSFLAGVSEPEALALRPNDFIHWRAMLAARAEGRRVYRLGPTFPEVPADWPIARVSAFKGKFGGEAVPMVVGSRFVSAQYAEAAAQRAAALMPALARPLRSAPPAPASGMELVAHMLRVVGAPALVVDAAAEGGWAAARAEVDAGRPAVVLRPDRAAPFLDGVTCAPGEGALPALFSACEDPGAAWARLRGFHAWQALTVPGGQPVVRDAAGRVVWAWLPLGRAGVLLLGTDLPRDLTLLRQGDPAAVANRPSEAQWGIAGERPGYLFEPQLEADRPADRMADWWLWTLREALRRHAGLACAPVLPFGAPGAVVVTGDDDQAPLEDYLAQAARLGPMPVTYFLHPLTKHDAASLARHSAGRQVEWELHPDALETPGEYGARLAEQVAWFTTLAGRPPRLVRNHGFLNDGYWGHAGPWLEQGIMGSSNLPGLDGRVINGSLLPGRLALRGALTAHWSLLTAFGDGVFFIHEWSDAEAEAAVLAAGRAVAASGVPGLLVFNLHPANQVKAAAMHQAVRRLMTELGFAAMTLGAALEWFGARDAGREPAPGAGMLAPGAPPRAGLLGALGRAVRKARAA